MKLLIAVISCRKFTARADVQRNTWVHEAVVRNIDVRFFIGGGQLENDYEVILPVEDDYPNVRKKVQSAMQWAVEHNYDHILKTDDDCVVFPTNWLKSGFYDVPYTGRLRGPSGTYPCDYDGKKLATGRELYGHTEKSFCSGFGYTVNNVAARHIAEAPDNGDWAEDRFAGNALALKGIPPKNNAEYLLWPLLGYCHGDPTFTCTHCLTMRSNAVVVCPYNQPDKVEHIYNEKNSSGLIPTGKP
jgi:hypothetical protein